MHLVVEGNVKHLYKEGFVITLSSALIEHHWVNINTPITSLADYSFSSISRENS